VIVWRDIVEDVGTGDGSRWKWGASRATEYCEYENENENENEKRREEKSWLLVVQQAETETESVVKVGLKVTQELGERVKKLESEIRLYRNMAIELATREGVEVPDFAKDGSGGSGEEQAGQLREWLGQLLLRQSAAGEEMTTIGRAPSRKRRRLGVGGGTSRGKRAGKDDDGAMAQWDDGSFRFCTRSTSQTRRRSFLSKEIQRDSLWKAETEAEAERFFGKYTIILWRYLWRKVV
jgi:hypothetical protein